MPYVERDPGTSEIVGLYNSSQPGVAEEWLPDDDPEVQMFLHPKKELISATDFVARFTNAEYVLLLKQRATDTAANKVGNSKNWDIVVTTDNININSQKTQTLKSDLVTTGVLTQARADEIFS